MEEIIKERISSLPQDNSWKFAQPLCLYEGFWHLPAFLEGTIFAQQNFKPPQPGDDDIFVCSSPKTGTTWLKALTFATVTRTHFNNSESPLLTKLPHDCIPFLERDFMIKNPMMTSSIHGAGFPLWSTHLPYSSLPNSIVESGCKIIYIWRDPKDVLVSLWHFMNKLSSNNNNNICSENISLEDAYELFCKGISCLGPYWDHVLGYWKACLECPDRVLFLKYEEMMEDTAFYLKILAKFIGYPFSLEEENEGAVQKIVELCSFDSLSNLEVNVHGKHRADETLAVNNNVYFRKGKVGDWRNYLTFEMGRRLDKIMENKLSGSGLK